MLKEFKKLCLKIGFEANKNNFTINDYYDKELKLDRLKKLGIEVSNRPTLVKYKSNIYESFSYYYLDIWD